ncbi:putative polymerase [Vibrio nigripulchritudo MADA3029]|uniref:DUF342 domain-containing protein n=1 Tax=Vibrio TaxID=662 RepID=UPI0003B1B5EA|nr:MULTISPECIES: FapA family protein [Vibrio]KJY79632.1 polymerase [Vibrio nigripulchritudo]UAB73281.1 DUF342 domain-containing protein [Vibrio sp. SCSIO 43132]CCN47310.1 putative polymerase [Vibrio nigripulchritudo MADA3020]CCN55175.1 putative polymerase [Vibrio nigripulchritudo MADA3021]CCN60954.1 putative polymerase [Vibrio nigripulchritudo MADA3029]
MWKEFIRLSDDDQFVIAQMPTDVTVESDFGELGLDHAIESLGAASFFLDDSAVKSFISAARKTKKEAFQGVNIAFRKNASVSVVLEDNDMIARMVVTGAQGGRALRGSEIVEALSLAKVTKGINKLALKKVLAMSHKVPPGQEFSQAVAQGKMPVEGKDAEFTPLFPDINARVLRPQEINSVTHKVDMRNLGETITVAENEELMRRKPATKGKPGFTVCGKVIPPKPGNDKLLREGKGTYICKDDPNLLRAAVSGMPMMKKGSTVEVDNALCLSKVDVSTGHIKFKGCVVITGDIEPGMKVLATGSITVGGFIESADVQAHGDITAAKGIIGRPIAEGEENACVVRSGGSITSKYAQYATIQAHDDVTFAIHSLQNDVRCGGDLTVSDANGKQGTLSGGDTQVGGKITCVNLGVEGDSVTTVEACARYKKYKDGIERLKESYKKVQEDTMKVVRAELELSKTPKAERTQEMVDNVATLKQKNNDLLSRTKKKLDAVELEFEQMLTANTITIKNKVYTRVTVKFGDDTVVTRREHGPSVLSYNHYEISFAPLMGS